MKNSERIALIYEAFGRGDIESIVSHFSDEIEWEYSGADTPVPWLKPRSGIESTIGFFAAVNESVEFSKFEPKVILDGPDVVVALLDVAFTVKATGRNVDERDEIHVFRFNTEGKITGFRHGVDSYAHYLAFTGE